MRLETKGEVEKKEKVAANPYIMDIHPGPEFIKPLKLKRQNSTETFQGVGPRFISYLIRSPFCT